MSYAEIPLDKDMVYDDCSFFDLLSGKTKESPRLTGSWSFPKIENPEPRLFNLSEDLGEDYNLYSDYPEIVERLKQRMQEFNHSIPVND